MPWYLRKLMAHGGYLDEAGDGASGGSTGGGAAGDAGGTEGAPGAGEGEGGEGGGSGKQPPKPSDAEAKLLKEVMERKRKQQELTTALEQANA